MSLIVKTEHFTNEDLIEIIKHNITIDLGALKIYNEANYFIIKKVYKEGLLSGYAVAFLGHNGLDSNAASIEAMEAYDELSLQTLIDSIKSKDGFPKFIEEFYYEPERFDEDLNMQLSANGFNAIGRTR